MKDEYEINDLILKCMVLNRKLGLHLVTIPAAVHRGKNKMILQIVF